MFHQIFETTSASACFLESYNFSNKGRHRICFPSSFTKFSRTPLLPNIFVVPLLRITIHIAFNQSVTNEIFIPLSEETSIHFKRPIAGITKMHEVLSSWIIISKINVFLKFSWAIHGLMNPFFSSSSLAFEAVAHAQRCSVNKVLQLLQLSHKSTSARVSVLKNFIKKESLAKIFSFKFWEISKNTFFMEHHRWLFLTVLLWKIKCYTFGRFLNDVNL